MTNRIKYALLVAIFLQLFILVSLYLKAQYPLWVGSEVKIAVEPVDPRSLFRGNYAHLNYSISNAKINQKDLINSKTGKLNPRIFYNAVVYTRLKKNKSGLYEAIDVVLDKPQAGLFIRGRIRNKTPIKTTQTKTNIEYGIEAFFAPKKRALEIQDSVRWRANADTNKPPAIVTLMISRSGYGAIKDLEVLD